MPRNGFQREFGTCIQPSMISHPMFHTRCHLEMDISCRPETYATLIYMHTVYAGIFKSETSHDEYILFLFRSQMRSTIAISRVSHTNRICFPYSLLTRSIIPIASYAWNGKSRRVSCDPICCSFIPHCKQWYNHKHCRVAKRLNAEAFCFRFNNPHLFLFYAEI